MKKEIFCFVSDSSNTNNTENSPLDTNDTESSPLNTTGSWKSSIKNNFGEIKVTVKSISELFDRAKDIQLILDNRNRKDSIVSTE